ncbi:Cleavage and polyadenylation specificity factor subunit 2 [Entamoeba marina]
MHVSKPLLMITDAGGIGKCRNQLDDAFKEVIGVIKRRGSVLIPIECSGRLMEYLTMFSTKWNVPGLKDVPIYCISPIQEDLLNANSTIVEWVKGCMDLKMKNVVFYPSYEKIKKDIKNERPFVVFATIQSLAVGTQSRELLKSLNGSDKNGIVFLEPTTNGTIADTLKTTRNILLDVWHTEEFTPEERLQWDEEHNQVIEQSIGEECEMSSEESESDENKALGGSKSTFWQYKTDVFADELDTVGGLFPFNSIRKSTTCYGDISDFKQDTTNKEITLTPDENDEKEIEEIPQKYVMEEQQFIVNMSVAQFDLTGNMETTKIHSIISKILPKNLYFVSHIDSPQWYRDNLPRINLFTRSTDIKEICPVTPTQTVSLSDALLQSLQMYKIDSYKLGSVNGLLQDGELVSINQKERKRQHSVYVGELPIKSLKKLIEDANIDVKIEKGIIICAHGTVTVTKIPSEVPLFTVRGRMNKEFFKIKKIVVDNFSVL